MENRYPYCQVIGQTDRGLKRAANEDHFGERQTPNGWVAVVCDGMGGHVGGATASHIAVDTILQFLTENYFSDAREAIGAAIDAANAAILRHTATHPDLKGMGSTCVLLIVRDGLVYIGHVGDSRIYLVRDHRIKQLTKDHSYVQMLVDSGSITAAQAERHPRKNEITNALGLPQMQPATVMDDAISPEAGDCFVLCSDGLSGMVSDTTIEHVVSQQKDMTAQQRANRLIEKAKEGGGLDNITAVLVEFATTPKATQEQTQTERRKKIGLWAGGIALCMMLVAGLVWLLMRSPQSKDEEAEQQQEVVVIERQDTVEITINAPHKENEDALVIRLTDNHIITFCSPDNRMLYEPIKVSDTVVDWNTALQYNSEQVRKTHILTTNEQNQPLEQIKFTPLAGIVRFALTIQGQTKIWIVNVDSPIQQERAEQKQGSGRQSNSATSAATSGPAKQTQSQPELLAQPDSTSRDSVIENQNNSEMEVRKDTNIVEEQQTETQPQAEEEP